MAKSNPIIAGDRFTRLAVKQEAPGKRLRHYLCICDCGAEKIVRRDHLLEGRVRSCGCLLSEVAGLHRLKHGHNRRIAGESKPTPEYRTWQHILGRCNNKAEKNFENYGGRGISVCARWEKFENFLADMGVRPGAGYSIDRIDNNGNYEPGNCRWATLVEQGRNRRSNVLLTYCGETKPASQWSEETGVPYFRLLKRIKRGMPPELIFANRALGPYEWRKLKRSVR